MACCTECDEGNPCAGDCPGCDDPMAHDNPCESGACALPNPIATAGMLADPPTPAPGIVSPVPQDQALVNFQTELARVRAEGIAEGAKKVMMPSLLVGAAVGATLVYMLVRWKVIKA